MGHQGHISGHMTSKAVRESGLDYTEPSDMASPVSSGHSNGTQKANPKSCPALVLNADYRPLSYLPLSLWNWQVALKAVFLGRVDIIAEYDTAVHSPSMTIKLPSVIALKDYVKQPVYPAFTRFNLFLRDEFTCQYCGSQQDLTFDHVIPRRSGGKTSWQNILAACAPCNLAKGGRSPAEANMFPRRPAYKPTRFELQDIGRAFPPNYLHDSWRDFLYWDTELDKD